MTLISLACFFFKKTRNAVCLGLTLPHGELRCTCLAAVNGLCLAEYKEELHKLASKAEYENKSLSNLRTKVLQEFSMRQEARGIIFTKTRRSAIALTQWIQENPKFADMDVKAAYVIGGGDQSVVKPMTAVSSRKPTMFVSAACCDNSNPVRA